MDVTLTPELEKWVRSKVATGLYDSTSEVVREALRIMHEFENERNKRLEVLRADIQVGIEQVQAGRVEPLSAATVEGIKTRGRERLRG